MRLYLIPSSNIEFANPNPGSHVDGIVGLAESPTVESLAKKIHELSVKNSIVEEAKGSTSSPQNVDAYNAQSTQKVTQ